jgi:hypothetical protein
MQPALPLLVVRSRHTLVNVPTLPDPTASAMAQTLSQCGRKLGFPVALSVGLATALGARLQDALARSRPMLENCPDMTA